MLPNTFLTIPGIGIKSEQELWEKGIRSGDDLFASANNGSPPKKIEKMKDSIRESQEQLRNGNVAYFASLLPLDLISQGKFLFYESPDPRLREWRELLTFRLLKFF